MHWSLGTQQRSHEPPDAGMSDKKEELHIHRPKQIACNNVKNTPTKNPEINDKVM
jgi:hypothetical protein